MKRHYLGIAVFMGLLIQSSRAETVDVKYRGIVDLKPFACSETSRRSFIRRVSYDRANQYMLIKLPLLKSIM
jgi:hypothetical protein